MAYPLPRPTAELRLFCLPFAGAGSAAYRPWASALPKAIELVCVQLPGRDRRAFEAAYTRMEPLAEDLAAAIAPELAAKPFALFGHSMGALIAYELARRLCAGPGRRPVHLFVSACVPPDDRSPAPMIHRLPTPQFLEALGAYDAPGAAALQDPALRDFVLPTLRADFELVETYRPVAAQPLEVPMTALAGRQDPNAPPQAMAGWSRFTNRDFRIESFPGGHFYLAGKELELLACLSRALL